jgi:hypothetical protein
MERFTRGLIIIFLSGIVRETVSISFFSPIMVGLKSATPVKILVLSALFLVGLEVPIYRHFKFVKEIPVWLQKKM